MQGAGGALTANRSPPTVSRFTYPDCVLGADALRQSGGQTTRLNVQARGTFTIAAQPVSTIPEPTSIALLASDLAGLLVRRRRQAA